MQHGIGGQLGVGPAEDACGVHINRIRKCHAFQGEALRTDGF